MKSIFFFSIFILVLFSSPYFVFAQVSNQPVSTQDLQSQIQNLLKQIQALQQQVAALQAELGKQPEKTTPAVLPAQADKTPAVTATPEVTPPEFTRSLSRGSSGDDVRKLQEFLAQDKDIYPEGLITGFFGPLTEAAVKKWQEKYQIESVGIVGPKTMAKFQELGQGRIQQLLEQGAGTSGIIPPGLLIAPGIQKKIEISANATSSTITTATTTSVVSATTTPSGTTPAIPATPAVPASPTSIASCLASPAIVNYTTSNSGIASNYISSIAVDGDGSVWFGHILGKMSRFDGTTWRVYDIPPYVNPASPTNRVPPNVYNIVIDSKGNKWVATNFGIGKFDGTNWTTYSTTYLPNNPFLSIISATSSFGGSEFLSMAFDKDGVGWFGSNMNGVWRFDGLSWKQYVYPPDKLIGSRVYDIVVDSQNNKWFATVEGVSKFDGTNWFNYATGNSGLKSNLVVAVEIDPQGFIWFGTDGGGVSKFDGKGWSAFNSDGPGWTAFSPSNSGLAGDKIVSRAIAFQPNGMAWFGTRYNGASSFDGADWRTLDTSKGLLSNVITVVAADARGNVWLANDNKGASLIKCEQAVTTSAPATSVVPSSGVGAVSVPATPATPALPAATSTTTTTITTNPNATDTTPPSVTLTGPYLGLSPTCLVLYSSSYSDNVAVFGVQRKIDGVNYGPEDTGSALNSSPGFTGTASGCVGGYLTDGTHTFTMVVRDAAGNVTTKSIAISIPYTGTAILFPTTMCAATVMNGYSVPSKSSGESVTVATSSSVTNGTRSASTTFTCSNGSFTAGPETANITCNSGYTSVGTQCVQNAPPAPTNVQAVTNSSGQEQPPIVRYYMVFDYTLQSTTQSFNIYRKRPSDASFVKYAYNAQTPVNPSILPIPGSDESNLYHRYTNQWEWWTTLPAPAPDTAVGEYKFYVTAVDTSGVESAPSETKSFKLYAAPVIASPAEGSTVSPSPTITVSGDPSAPSQTYGMVIYKQTTGNTAWSAWPAPSTSFTYSGSTLSPSDNPHRLVVWFSSGIYDRSFFATSIFNVSTTISFLDSRAKNLAAISQNLDVIKEKLLKLLQGL